MGIKKKNNQQSVWKGLCYKTQSGLSVKIGSSFGRTGCFAQACSEYVPFFSPAAFKPLKDQELKQSINDSEATALL